LVAPYRMDSWTLDADTALRVLADGDAATVYEVVRDNRDHLDRWLRWSSQVRSLEDAEELVARFRQKAECGEGFHWGIWYQGRLAGGLVCWYIEPDNRNAEIGYWLREDMVGRGLATRSASCALRHLFEDCQLHRVEMQCAVANVRSRSIPERLGFTLEGTRRESHWITDRFVDHVVYGLLAPEWRRLHSNTAG